MKNDKPNTNTWVVFSLSGFILITLSTLEFFGDWTPIRDPFAIIAYILMAVGIAGVFYCVFILQRYSLGMEPLVVAGPYRVVRHPTYLSGLIWGTGNILQATLTSEFLSLLMSAGGIICFSIAVRIEDEFNIKKFGAQYRRYMLDVPSLNFLRSMRNMNKGQGHV